MTDVHTPEQRSRNMSAVRNRDTKAEVVLRSGLRARKLLGYRCSPRSVPGSPDVAFTRWKVAVFVDGCFWHGCPECYRAPSTNTVFWSAKLQTNRQRDASVNETLDADGWTVLRLWEHEIRRDPDRCAEAIQECLRAAGRV